MYGSFGLGFYTIIFEIFNESILKNWEKNKTYFSKIKKTHNF